MCPIEIARSLRAFIDPRNPARYVVVDPTAAVSMPAGFIELRPSTGVSSALELHSSMCGAVRIGGATSVVRSIVETDPSFSSRRSRFFVVEAVRAEDWAAATPLDHPPPATAGAALISCAASLPPREYSTFSPSHENLELEFVTRLAAAIRSCTPGCSPAERLGTLSDARRQLSAHNLLRLSSERLSAARRREIESALVYTDVMHTCRWRRHYAAALRERLERV